MTTPTPDQIAQAQMADDPEDVLGDLWDDDLMADPESEPLPDVPEDEQDEE